MITSLDNKRIKEFLKLQKKKYRTDQYLIYGEHLVSAAVASNQLDVLIFHDLEEVKKLKIKTGELSFKIELLEVNEEVFKKFEDLTTTPGLIGVCKKQEQKLTKGSILGLNNLMNPGNIGTLIRTAKAFGIENVILDEKTTDLYNSKIIQAMQGVHFSLNIVQGNLWKYTNEFSGAIYTTFLDEDNTFLGKEDSPTENDFILILGNESTGIEHRYKELKHQNIKIAIDYESLNVGIAGGIIMHQLTKGENNGFKSN